MSNNEQNITFERYAAKYLNICRLNKKKFNTLQMYITIIQTHLMPSLGQLALNEITKDDLQKIIDKKTKDGLTRTVEQIHMIMKQMFSEAYNEDYIAEDISRNLTLSNFKKTEVLLLSSEELEAIAKTPLSLKERVIVNLILLCGLKRGEVYGLQIRDFDTRNHTVTISRQVVFELNSGVITNNLTTRTSHRRISLPEDIRETLYTLLKNIGLNGPETLLFTNENGSCISKSGHRKMWVRINNEFVKQNHDIQKVTAELLLKSFLVCEDKPEERILFFS